MITQSKLQRLFCRKRTHTNNGTKKLSRIQPIRQQKQNKFSVQCSLPADAATTATAGSGGVSINSFVHMLLNGSLHGT